MKLFRVKVIDTAGIASSPVTAYGLVDLSSVTHDRLKSLVEGEEVLLRVKCVSPKQLRAEEEHTP